MIEALQRSSFTAPGPMTGTSPKANVPAEGTDFASVLGSFATSTINSLRQAESSAAQGILGTLPAQDVVESIMSAERELQTVLAVRDKLVGAYLEISRMQI